MSESSLKQAEIDVGADDDGVNVIDEPELNQQADMLPVEKPSRKEMLSSEAQNSKGTKMDPKKNERVIGGYILGKTIGEGTFGKVKIGKHQLTKAKVAVKILEKSKIQDVADAERVQREIHILKIVQHPHVVQLYEIIETPKKLYLIMEYASGGELFDYIVKHQRIQEKEACLFFQQLLSGIEYVSRLNIVHRDLKPENLLLDFDKGIKIVDFGLSNTYKTGELLKTACGSPCYAAPEMIAGKKYNGTNVDIWSCGVILFALICGFLPFEDPNTSNLYKKILSADFQTPNYVSDEAKDLFHCILNTDPEKRYTIEQIRQHPWFNLAKCESNFKGIKVGVDPVPIDNNILDRMQSEYDINKNYARKCIQANKHNHVTASYYLLLKEVIKSGGKSVADVRSPDYNPAMFQISAEALKNEMAREKLENASIQNDEVDGHAIEDTEIEDTKILNDLDNGAFVDEEANSTARNEDKAKEPADEKSQRSSRVQQEKKLVEEAKPSGRKREKSTQPQRLRKIADGLHEFERYADRRKRLQSISSKNKRIGDLSLDHHSGYGDQLSQNQQTEELLSNGGLDLLKRGLSPVCGPDGNIPDTISQGLGLRGNYSLSKTGQFDMGEYIEPAASMANQNGHDRDQSPGLSPHSIRVNAQRAANGMQTQYGNFLYQVDAKQFPSSNGQQQVTNQGGKNQNDIQLQMVPPDVHQLNQQQPYMFPMPPLEANQNNKHVHKQLKQFYLQQKKAQVATQQQQKKNGVDYDQSQQIVLKNLVNSQKASNNSGKLNKNSSQLSKIQLLQQNYAKKSNNQSSQPQQPSGGHVRFSTIQTAFETLQNNPSGPPQNFGKKKSGSGSNAAVLKTTYGQPSSKRGTGGQQGFVPVAPPIHHQRYQTTQYGTAKQNASTGSGNAVVFNTINQNYQSNPQQQSFHKQASSSPENKVPAAPFNKQQRVYGAAKGGASTQSTFLTGNNGSKLTNKPTASQMQQNSVGKQPARKNMRTTVSGSGSLGPAGSRAADNALFSPKNLPSNQLGFGFGLNTGNFDNVLTPQTGVQRQMAQSGAPNQQHMFTIDATNSQQHQLSNYGQLNRTIQQPTVASGGLKNRTQSNNFVSHLVQSLKPQMPRKASQVQAKLKVGSKQHSQPIVNPGTASHQTASQKDQLNAWTSENISASQGQAGGSKTRKVTSQKQGLQSAGQGTINYATSSPGPNQHHSLEDQSSQPLKRGRNPQQAGSKQVSKQTQKYGTLQHNQQLDAQGAQIRDASDEKPHGASIYSSRFMVGQGPNTLAQDNTGFMNLMRNYKNHSPTYKASTAGVNGSTQQQKPKSYGGPGSFDAGTSNASGQAWGRGSNAGKVQDHATTGIRSPVAIYSADIGNHAMAKPPLAMLSGSTQIDSSALSNDNDHFNPADGSKEFFQSTQDITGRGVSRPNNYDTMKKRRQPYLRQGSQDRGNVSMSGSQVNQTSIQSRLNNTTAHPLSSQKKLSKGKQQTGSGVAKNAKLSMLKINDNDCQQVTNALSTKNATNLFSPIAQVPVGKKSKDKKAMLMLDDYHSAVGAKMSIQQQNAALLQQENIGRIQAQLQRKMQQRQQSNEVKSFNAGRADLSFTQPLNNSINMVTAKKVTEDAQSAVLRQMQLNADQFAQTSTPQHVQPQMKSNLNSSLVAKQKSKGNSQHNGSMSVGGVIKPGSPHVMLQSYHGTGYPPISPGLNTSQQVPQQQLISPQNIHFAPLSPVQNNGYMPMTTVTSPQNPQLNESLMNSQGSILQHSKKKKQPKSKGSGQAAARARKTPQGMSTAGGIPTGQGSMLLGNAKYDCDAAGQRQQIDQMSPKANRQDQYDKRHYVAQHMQNNYMEALRHGEQVFQAAARNAAQPTPTQNVQRAARPPQHASRQASQQPACPSGNPSLLRLDNSNIDFQDDVDISNNTISNINQQLSQAMSRQVNNDQARPHAQSAASSGNGQPTKKKLRVKQQ